MTESPSSQQTEQQTQHRLLSGLRLVGICTLLSRLLGLARDIGMATLFGNNAIMDAFSVAFRIPNLARRLFGEGALTAAFLPVFVREKEQNGLQAAWKLASSVFAALTVFLCLLVLCGESLLGTLSLYGNFSDEAELLILLTAMMLPYLILICLAAQISAVLHAFDRFLLPALLPVLLNVTWLIGLWFAVSYEESPVAQIKIVAWCIVIGGLLQCLAPLPALFRLGFRYRFCWDETKSSVNEIGRTMLPIILGLSITQLNVLADSLIAWGFSAPSVTDSAATITAATNSFDYPLSAGTASALYFGQRMYQFPLGVFGIALGTVLFPLFAKHAQAGQHEQLRKSLSYGLRLVLCIGIPASVGLMLLAEPLTVLLFQHGAFDSADTQQTAGIIRCYGAGVWAYCGLLIIHRAFYAIGDRQTPLRIGLITVAINLLLNLTLIWWWAGQGLATATAIAAVIQLILIAQRIQSHIGSLDWKSIGKTALQTIIATAAMSAATQLTSYSLSEIPDSFNTRFLQLVIPLTTALATFAITAHFIGLTEFQQLIKRKTSSDGVADKS